MASHWLNCYIAVLLFATPIFGIELANICDLLQCENGGTCLTDGDDGYCECLPGYSGYRCEHDTNLCEPNPCYNSGKCILENGGTDRRCLCRAGFFGTNCERGPCGKECSTKYQPVCGSDGYTYQNGCELEKASCLDNSLICASLGECASNGCRCKCMPIKDPVCGTDCITYDNECELNNARKCSNPSLRKSYHGDCRAFTCGLRKPYKCNTCLRLTGEVCGSDGQRYSSECQLRVKACRRKSLHMIPCQYNDNTTHCERPDETVGMIMFVQGKIDDETIVSDGTQVGFSCEEGYSLHGKDEINCKNGEFDFPVPKCYKNCDDDPILNGKAAGSFEHSTSVTFGCNKGYTLEGLSSLICLKGKYDGVLPICQVNCDDPGKLLNGNVEGPFTHGSLIRFTCNDGYTLIGNDISTCVDGVWTSYKPRCYENCDLPVMPSELTSSGEPDHGKTVTFKCMSGYTMYGESSSRCTDGAWSSPAPACLAGCEPPTSIENGRFEGSFDHGARIVVFCNDGYSVDGNHIISCSDGVMSSGIPVCRKNCQAIDVQEYRIHTGSYTHGSVITFSCTDGRNLYGASEIMCENGVYSDELPNCYVKCAPVVTPENGIATGSNLHGQTLTFSCEAGYKLVGEKSIKCFNGVYSGDVPPICYENCNDLVLPNGEIEGDAEHGSTLVFKCNQDFTLIGRLSAVCTDGVLSNDLPECKRNCFPFEFLNGMYVGSMTHGSELVFSCNNDYALVGASRLECNDGQYSAIIPACYENCNGLVEPPNGYIIGDIAHGKAVQYGCYAGYTLVGPSNRTCTDGSWDSLAPSCHENCDPIDTFENGVVVGAWYHQESYTFSCNAGYSLHGRSQVFCIDGQYSTSFPACYRDCESSISIVNGQYTGSFTHGGSITFTCDVGYTLVGETTITCENGQYSSSYAECKANCESSISIINGQYTGSFTHGGSITFTCDVGYTLVGERTITCDNGQYSSSYAECRENCDSSTSVANGKVFGSFIDGGSINIVCDGGYTLVGESTVSCNSGQFSSAIAECRANCQTPSPVINGQVQSYQSHGGITTFTCNDGYTLVGVSSTVCLDGQYQDTFPVCYANCESSILIINGGYSGRNTHGGSITFTCDDGYTLEGERTITCDNGQYSSSYAKCRGNCESSISIVNGQYSGSFTHGGSVTFTCDVGYTLVGERTITCDNGQYSSSYAVCKANCESSISILNGRYTGNFTHGGSITFTCDVGYTLVGETTITCDNGQYSSSYAVCRADCEQIVQFANGDVSGSFMHDGRVKFTCNEGYRLEGKKKLTCSDGQYDYDVPICYADCQRVELLNGKIIFKAKHGSVSTFVCDEGYTLVGPNSTVCDNGQFADQPPICAENCESTISILNGRYTGSFTHGGSITFTCDVGYTLVGETTITCENGQYSSSYAICRRDCNEHPTLANGLITGEYRHSDSVFFYCLDGYSLFGANTANCIDGQYIYASGLSQPECYANCDDAPILKNGNVSYSSNIHGSSLNYQCSEGYSLVGANTAVCDNGNYVIGSEESESKCYANCVPITDFQNGQLEGSFDHGQRVRFSCNEDYTLVGRKKVDCNDGQYNGDIPSCFKNCESPPFLDNGRVDAVLNHGGVAKFKCNDGYTLIGAARTTCINGQFEELNQQCLGNCNEFTIPNGQFSGSFQHGGAIEITCDFGYSLVGSNIITCEDGQLSSTDTQCIADCLTLPPLDNGVVNGNSTHGSVVTFECNDDYTRVGGSYAECDAGNFVYEGGLLPTCYENCFDEPILEYGSVTKSSNNHGSTIDYTCNEGYSLVGAKFSTCDDGQYVLANKKKEPTCYANCEPIFFLPNGLVTATSFEHDGRVRFSCFDGYTLVGRKKLTCNNGKYSDEIPVCYENCALTPLIPNGSVQRTSDAHASTMDISCDSGYNLVGASSATCNNGTYEYPVNELKPVCYARCTSLPDVDFATVQGRLEHNSMVFFTCIDGYELVGESSATCIDGSYVYSSNTSLPKCYANCPPESIDFPNGQITGSLRHGSVITFTCDGDYTLVGYEEIACVDGALNVKLPECYANCEQFGPISDALVTGETTHNETVYISCNAGFSLVGSDRATCYNGNFDVDAKSIECFENCQDIDNLVNGFVTGSSEHGGSLSFSCITGYTLVGSAEVRCYDGLYDNSLPICSDNCDEIEKIENGEVSGSFSHGGVLTFKCNDGYILVGSPVLECTDGIYNTASPVCRANCRPLDLENGLVNGGNNHGDKVRFRCNDGYSIVGRPSLSCRDGQYNGEAPVCYADCTTPPIILNAEFVGNSKHGDSLFYSCVQGYTAVGVNYTTCDDGTFADFDFSCKKNCEYPAPLGNGTVQADTNHGGIAVFNCAPRFTLVGVSETTCNDGNYEDPNPECFLNCGVPVIPNSKINGSAEHGKSIEVSCDDMFTLVGEPTLTCSSGIFEKDDTICSPNCLQPAPIQNGQVAAEVVHGGSSTYSCDDGFTPVGTLKVKCEFGNYQTEPPKCYKNCNNSLVIPNGQYSGSFDHGGSINITCDEGYTAVGKTTILCDDGEFNHKPAKCKENCAPLTEIVNGQFTGGFNHGDIITITCNVGYSIVGKKKVTCKDGSYNAEFAICQADCKEPEALVNGNIQGKYKHNDNIRFTCNPGYSLVGVTNTVCENGQYLDPNPVCYENCGPSLVIRNGRYIGSLKHDGAIYIICDAGFSLEGQSNMTCYNGQLSSEMPVCRGDCTQPSELIDGTIVADLVHGGVTTFSCNEGFTLVGVDSSVCLDGLLTDPSPECFANCPSDNLIKNGEMSGSLTHGQNATFTCNAGYTLVGNYEIFCYDGQYSSNIPSCKLNCAKQSNLENGIIKNDITHGGKTSYRCFDNFSLVGADVVYCEDGKYTSPKPTCYANCEATISIINGKYTGSFTHGGSITFTCDVGYTLVGETTITCENGQYSSSYAVCRENCDSTTSVANGQVFGSFIHGGSFNIVCNVDYTLVGESTVSCNNGQFSSAIAECRANCQPPSPIINGQVQSYQSHGGITTFTCNDGYTLVGVSSTMCLDGQYQDAFPVCSSNCESSISIVNGQYTGSFTHGGSITFTCDVGYTLVGETTITCENGQYSSSYAVCKANCQRIQLLNGKVIFRAKHGSVSTFVCDEGYTLVGPSSTVCDNGQFTDKLPVCEANCESSISIVNGQYTGSFSHGGSITFTCDVGYTLVGETTITCDNGKYSSSYAECKANCESSILIINGGYSGRNTHGGSITFICNVGYTLVGERTITCDNGQYSSSYAECKANCDSTTSVANGQVFGSFIHGGSFNIVCNVDYKLVGESTVSCNNGQFSSAIAECRLNCQTPSPVINGRVESNQSHGGITTFTCFDGYTLVGVSSTMCLDGQYQDAFPVCSSDCESSISIVNGQYSGSFIHGGSITFTCDVGYTLVGETTITCDNGQYSSSYAVCRANCESSISIVNGQYSGSFTHGGSITFTCDVGYTLVGERTITCDNGQYSSSYAECKANCDSTTSVANGQVFGSFIHGGSFNIVCNVDYKLVGESTVSCNNGQFSSAIAECRLNCQTPSPVINGRVESNQSHGGITTFTCFDGYTLVGVSSTMCLDGQYQDAFPVCSSDCESSISIVNGQYSGSFIHGGSITFTCDVGYTLVGETTITCDNGQYSSSYAVCRANCESSISIVNGQYSGSFTHGGSITFTCDVGYTLVGERTITCDNGQYSSSYAECKANCDSTTSVANGQVFGSFIHGGSFNIVCNVDYKLVGESTVSCNNGQFSSAIAECRLNCQTPSPVINGRVESNQSHGGITTITCFDGYTLVGVSSTMCLDGQYQDAFPVCSSDCESSISIVNGQYSGSFIHGGSITFTCDVGYTLVGETTITCDNGQYSSSYAVCRANCESSISIVNGQYSGSFTHGGSITFTCDVGYTLVGERTITCDNGQYSSSYAECKANCDSTTSVANGQVFGSFIHGGSFNIVCNVDYKLVGESTVFCNNGQFSSAIAECRLNCQTPSPVINGRVESNQSHGGITTFTCFDGYTLVGVSSTMCLDGQYQDAFPVCSSDCESSISIVNGQYSGSFIHGGSITFTCDVGYTLVGETTITCDNGQYSSSYAVCRANCESSISIVNGQYSGSFTHGGSITFTCDVGYTLVGERTITCDNGQYSSSYAECKANCDSTTSVANGQVFGSFIHGGSFNIVCNVDYKLVGESTVSCNNGQFSSAIAECRLNCQTPSPVINGRVESNQSHGGITTITCFDGYTLVGVSSTMCLDGQYQDAFPVCYANCESSISIVNGQYSGSFTHGGSITFTCDVGYTLVGETTITCDSGQYSSSYAICRANCFPLGGIENGRVTGGFNHNDRVTIICNDGFTLVGQNQAFCDDGLYSNALGTCYANCSPLITIENGVFIGGYNHGDSVTFICNNDYTLVGERIVTCYDGAFSAAFAECKANCAPLESPVNGVITGSFSHGDVIGFSCDVGYTLTGKPQIFCVNGVYSDVVAECHMDCQQPSLILNGRFNGSTYHGGVVQFYCFDGFQLLGNEYLNCQDGIFLEEHPSCVANCKDPGTPSAGFRHSSSLSHEGIIHFGCTSGFSLDGDEYLLCENGTWNASIPQCNPCEEGATYFNGSCYNLKYRREFYDIAQERCEEENGHLATFTTQQELKSVQTEALYDLRFYIGIKAQEDNWGRETSEESSYFNWPQHNCAYHKTDRWDNLVPCTDKKQFICETPRNCQTNIYCLSKSIQYNGHCYQVQDINTRSWMDAQKYCQSSNGNLVVISDLEEQKAVNDLINDCGPFPETQFWIGLSRETIDSEWTWVVPSVPYEFKYWPDFRCAYILSENEALPWYHSECDDFRFPYICQKSAALNPGISNPCDNDPCVNGGKCFSKVTEDFSDYYCNCPRGNSGKNCEKRDVCDGFRCENQKCIQCMFTCDREDNCGDNSDEGCRGQLTKCP
ncbi:CUB and sushi domain-containing protein 3-like isoform X4 [Antedon mediterranea]|uniref:CUB and sushi domain-containing protein 3-like isoform X4 n=1 Tax=Antedon mediterranea TaxID=105859 RepID=UPI003AF8B6C9